MGRGTPRSRVHRQPRSPGCRTAARARDPLRITPPCSLGRRIRPRPTAARAHDDRWCSESPRGGSVAGPVREVHGRKARSATRFLRRDRGRSNQEAAGEESVQHILTAGPGHWPRRDHVALAGWARPAGRSPPRPPPDHRQPGHPQVNHLRSTAIRSCHGSLRMRSHQGPPVVISDRRCFQRGDVLWTGSLKRSIRPARPRPRTWRPRAGSLAHGSERYPRTPQPRSARPATERLQSTTAGRRDQPAGRLFGPPCDSSARMAC